MKRIIDFIHRQFRHALLRAKQQLYKAVGMDIHPTALISLRAKLDFRNPKGIKVGANSYIAFGSVLLTHDMSRNMYKDIEIGRNCFIGCNSIILPGVKLGDSVTVAAGSVVTRNFDSNVMIGGNPAKVIREGLVNGPLGIARGA